MTQARLAETLGISDRAVSKWENGKNLPDSGIMLRVCDLLGISVNELLSGERLSGEHYKAMAEKNLVVLQEFEEQSNKRLLSLEVVIGYLSSLTFLGAIFLASFCALHTGIRIAVITYGSRFRPPAICFRTIPRTRLL